MENSPLRFPSFQGKRGGILIITLWIIVLLSIIAFIVTNLARTEIKITKSLLDEIETDWITRAACNFIMTILKQDTNGYDGLNERWSNYSQEVYGVNLFRNHHIGKGWFTVSYVYSEDIFSGEQHIFYGLIDEERKININTASQETLESLLGITPEIAQSILAWRGDKTLPQDILFGEDSYYKSLNLPYPRKEAPFQSIEELLLVKGITPELLYGKDMDNDGKISLNEMGIIRYITVYGDGKVNINTADPTVLMALGMNEELVYKIIRFRAGEDEIVGTSDDQYFSSIDNISTVLNSTVLNTVEPLTPEEEQELKNLKDKLKTTSRFYTGNVVINTSRGGEKEIKITIDKENLKIIKWVE